jgi:hypothetical protein
MDSCPPSIVALTGLTTRSLSSFHPFLHVDGRHSRGAHTVRRPVLVSVVTPSVLFRDTSAASAPLLIAPAPEVGL